MDRLIEPQELSQEIIAKIGNDYIKRYSLKQSVSPSQLHSDTNRLIEELELYNRTIKQVKGLASSLYSSLEEKMYETMLRVIQFLARYVQRLEIRGTRPLENTSIVQTICQGCSSNLNAKKIQTMRRQIFDYLPVFGKEQLQQGNQNRYSQQQSVYLLGNEQTIKRMGQLQRNLQQKQLGLMRCIDQFEDFRANLLIGMPRHSMDRGLQDKFNTKDYVFKLALHFSNSLRTIQDKINHLKAICKKSEERSTQCNIKDHSEEQQLKTIISQQKASILRLDSQIKKVNDARSRLQQHGKIYVAQIKVLNTKLQQLQQQNQTLKHQIFVQKLKSKGKNPQEKKQQLQVQDQTKDRNSQTSSKPRQSIVDDISIANEVLSQLNKRRSQLEQSGAKMEEALPYLRNTFKKALDHFISQRVSSNIDRKRLYIDPNEIENSQAKGNKKQKRSSKALLTVESKKKQHMRIDINPSRMNPRNFLKIFNNQVNYKINGVKRHNTRNLSQTDDKNSFMGDNSHKENSRFLYKHSTLQTEGNLKKRGLHIKLSSLSSEVKDSIGYESKTQMQIQYGICHPDYTQSFSYNGQQSEGTGLNIGQNELSEFIQRAEKVKPSKHKSHLKRRKNGSMTTLAKIDSARQKMDNLIKIKKIQHKTLTPEVLQNFFEPSLHSETSSPQISGKIRFKDTNIEIHGVSTSREQKQPPQQTKIKIQEDRHAKMKIIFNKLKSLGKTDGSSQQQQQKEFLRHKNKKQTLNLDILYFDGTSTYLQLGVIFPVEDICILVKQIKQFIFYFALACDDERQYSIDNFKAPPMLQFQIIVSALD